MDRSGGRASARSMDGVLGVLRRRRACSASIPRAPARPTAGSTRARPASRGWCCRPACRWCRSAMINTQLVPSRFSGFRHAAAGDPDRHAAGLQPRTPAPATTATCCAGHRRDHGRGAWSCPGRPTSTRTAARSRTRCGTGASCRGRVVSRPGEGRPAPPPPGAGTSPRPDPAAASEADRVTDELVSVDPAARSRVEPESGHGGPRHLLGAEERRPRPGHRARSSGPIEEGVENVPEDRRGHPGQQPPLLRRLAVHAARRWTAG